MVVTHADLAPSPKGSDLGSKTGAFIIVFSIVLGLFCFILSLIAEATRSEVNWAITNGDGKGIESQCTYTGSGKLPLLSGAAAFFALAVAMAVYHTYLLVAVSKSDALVEVAWDPDSAIARSLTWQAGFFFVSTWVSFAVGEVLLLIGLSMESGHLNNWAALRPNCLVNKQGLFAAGGVCGLVAVFLAAGLYITALRVEMHFLERENTRREILEASAMYATPPRTPVGANAGGGSGHGDGPQECRNNNLDVLYYYYYYSAVFDKQYNIV
ncbi:Protein of unknown function (DUF1218 [Striga hermonthica]|uniref:Uncharacterized protein n=1 Tax=Striga hermonthica TaxID=68872 RepID=A0A9N7NRI8_STRHE|nr:Protein of unknown function (DUF1218 [Striga hermonthica]